MWPVRAIRNIDFLASRCKQIVSSIKYTTKMVHKHASNDIDFVQPTQYTVPKNKIAKKPPPEPEPLPHFDPLPMHNENEYGQPKLPANINNKDPRQLFQLFWTDEIIDQLVEYTNRNAELHPASEDKEFARAWRPTSRQELYAYLAVLIHMGLHIERSIKDYWYKDFSYGLMHIIWKYIGAN
jgi:Transposase IS4